MESSECWLTWWRTNTLELQNVRIEKLNLLFSSHQTWDRDTEVNTSTGLASVTQGLKILTSCSCSSHFEVRRQDKRKSASCGSNILEQTLQFKGILKMDWSTGNILYTWRWHYIHFYFWYKFKKVHRKKTSFSSPTVALALSHLSLTPSVQLVHRTFYGRTEGVFLSLSGVLRLNLNLHKSTLWGSLSTLKHLICL